MNRGPSLCVAVLCTAGLACHAARAEDPPSRLVVESLRVRITPYGSYGTPDLVAEENLRAEARIPLLEVGGAQIGAALGLSGIGPLSVALMAPYQSPAEEVANLGDIAVATLGAHVTAGPVTTSFSVVGGITEEATPLSGFMCDGGCVALRAAPSAGVAGDVWTNVEPFVLGIRANALRTRLLDAPATDRDSAAAGASIPVYRAGSELFAVWRFSDVGLLDRLGLFGSLGADTTLSQASPSGPMSSGLTVYASVGLAL